MIKTTSWHATQRVKNRTNIYNAMRAYLPKLSSGAIMNKKSYISIQKDA
jgi:hypothetical protein